MVIEVRSRMKKDAGKFKVYEKTSRILGISKIRDNRLKYGCFFVHAGPLHFV